MAINARRDISSVLDRLENYEVEGGGVIASCPAHDDRHASLKIDINESGTLLAFCRAGCTFASVASALGMNLGGRWTWPENLAGVGTASSARLPVSEDRLNELTTFVRAANRALEPYTDTGQLALNYLVDRFGIDADQANALRLGVTERNGVQWEPVGRSWTAVPRLVVPFLDFDGRPIGAQARALADHEVRWTGLRNEDNGASWSKLAVMPVNNGLDFVIVTEGPSDGLTAYGAGYTALVLRGAALGRDEDTLDTIAERLHGSIVMVAGDNDPAGDTFRENLLTELTARGMDARPLVAPPEFSDLTEWRENDPEAFPRALEGAIRNSAGRNAIPTPVGPWQDFIAAHGYPDTIVAPGATNATAAEAVLWTMRHRGENVIYIRGYGLVPYCEGKWWPAHEHKLRTIMHRLGRQARAFTLPPLPTGPDPQQEAIRSLGMKLGQRYFLDATTKELGAMVQEHRADDLDSIPYLLLVENGVVDLRTGDLRDPRPDMLLSSRLEFAYDPEAQCPRWEAFLSEVMNGDADMVGFLKRLIGYGITGETKEQCFGILHGRGANGKTVLIEALTYVFGAITKTVPFSVFEDGSKGNGPSPELARLRGARLTMTSEGDQGKPMKESLVKSMTGSDTITARHLYQEEVEFHPRHLILMATNHKPVFHGVDEGLWRRVKLIPFSRYFAPDERDHYLLDTLKGEAPGILRWAVEGAVAWYAHGLQDPAPVLAATESYRENSDILAGFYPGVLVEAPGTDTKLSTIYSAFEEWADEEGINEYSSRWLSGALEERGLTKARRRSGMVMLGCRLTTEAERVGLYDD